MRLILSLLVIQALLTFLAVSAFAKDLVMDFTKPTPKVIKIVIDEPLIIKPLNKNASANAQARRVK